jgi:hypothetical protein
MPARSSGGDLSLSPRLPMNPIRFHRDELLRSIRGPEFVPSIARGVSYAAMLSGLAQHNAYHGGQIVLLKYALRRGAQGAAGQ